MKAAAAVLGASLLFFLGVLTGAGRHEAVPPPVAIPLGVVDSTTGDTSSSPSSSSPADPGGAAKTTTTTGRATPTAPAAPSPSGPAGSPGPPAETPAATTPPDGVTTSTGRGQVEEVDNQVDCTPADKKGKGRDDPCPSTTTVTSDPQGGGRGGNRNG